MDYRILGRTRLEVSAVGFGGIPIQGVGTDEATILVKRALELGITFFDSARAYTDSEEKLGTALIGQRQNVIVATKSMAGTALAMMADIEVSLRALRTQTIDLYQIHNPGNVETLDRIMGEKGAIAALVKAKEQGKVRFIGITGHYAQVFDQALTSGIFDTVQLPYNPMETRWQKAFIEKARAASLGIIGMKPLAGGALKHIEPALRFALAPGGVDVAIPGMDHLAQVDQNAAAVCPLLSLSEADQDLLAQEAAKWQGHFCRRCGYCMPCPSGLNIPFLLLIEAYYTRYGLKDWALERLAGVRKTYKDCLLCGDCTKKCPYQLPVPQLMSAAVSTVKPK